MKREVLVAKADLQKKIVSEALRGTIFAIFV